MDVDKSRRRSISPHQGTRLSSEHWPARAQRLLESCYAICVEGLHEPLRRCLGGLEQELFARAERAHMPAEQQDYFASRQRVLQDRAAFEQRFMEHLGHAINHIGKARDEDGATAAETKPWLTLELLDPVEQEQAMAVEQVGSRGDVRHSSMLYELGYRMAVLIGAPPLEGLALPIGPMCLARACHDAGATLELPPAHVLMLLQHFDQSVIQTLAPVYSRVNSHLQDDGILPQLRSIPIPRHLSKQRARPNNAANPANAEAGNDAVPVNNAGAGSGSSSGSGDSIAVLESLRDLLSQQRLGQGNSLHGSAGRAASPDELQTAMAALQQHFAQVTDKASRELRSAARLHEELLAQLNINTPSGAPRTQLSPEQGDTVELVAMLFEQLGQQLQQGGTARNLLGGLQMPVLRMAVTDREFFEQREHPARKLLDTVTTAANDWLDGSDDESNQPLASKLEQLVNRASKEAPSNDLYANLLADIEQHLALLTRKTQAAERRHVEAAQGRERLDQARSRAGELMAERFAASPPRGLLRALLDRAWSDVLALTLLRHGEKSDDFAAQLKITDQLLGSVPVEDRLHLQQDVESGLQQIGMHAEEAEQVAQRLIGAGEVTPGVELPSATDLAMRLKQHQRLGEHQSRTDSAVSKPAAASPDAKPATATTAAAAKPSPTPAPPTTTTDPRVLRIEQRLRELPFGSWFEFIDPASGQIARRKLAWYSPMSGRCLLVSRRGQRGEEMTMVQLAHEIASGRVCEVTTERESLLDRAWRNLTGKLRQKANAAHPDPQGA